MLLVAYVTLVFTPQRHVYLMVIRPLFEIVSGASPQGYSGLCVDQNIS